MKLTASAAIALFAACQTVPPPDPDYDRPLPYDADALLPLGPDEVRPRFGEAWLNRDEIRPALERSIRWTSSAYATQFFPMASITHGRALASLVRFAELLDEAHSASEFDAMLAREFKVFKSAGWDGEGGGVLFTGYCTPILYGSLERADDYRYPLYALPPDLEKARDGTILGQRTPRGLQPYPTRKAIEAGHLLAGRELELVWMREPLDAFIAHVNGSAIVRLREGGEKRLGYAGKNGREYTSLGAELVADKHIEPMELSLASIREWASNHPELLEEYMWRNDSFVFFAPVEGDPRGSLNLEVLPHRSLATDKRLFPRGAIVFVDTSLPIPGGGSMPFRRVMFDQDTGGAIRTAGRADIYLGIGPNAERRAGTTRAEGQLYYLFLDE